MGQKLRPGPNLSSDRASSAHIISCRAMLWSPIFRLCSCWPEKPDPYSQHYPQCPEPDLMYGLPKQFLIAATALSGGARGGRPGPHGMMGPILNHVTVWLMEQSANSRNCHAQITETLRRFNSFLASRTAIPAAAQLLVFYRRSSLPRWCRPWWLPFPWPGPSFVPAFAAALHKPCLSMSLASVAVLRSSAHLDALVGVRRHHRHPQQRAGASSPAPSW
jgi:hypothetical protein